MVKTPDSQNKDYKKGKEAWNALVMINGQLYRHQRIMRCLPKKKRLYHNKIIASILAKRMSALSTWDKISEKLSPSQLTAMRYEIYL